MTTKNESPEINWDVLKKIYEDRSSEVERLYRENLDMRNEIRTIQSFIRKIDIRYILEEENKMLKEEVLNLRKRSRCKI
jgi:predicted DNA-binding ribbon-helix-helix protein